MKLTIMGQDAVDLKLATGLPVEMRDEATMQWGVEDRILALRMAASLLPTEVRMVQPLTTLVAALLGKHRITGKEDPDDLLDVLNLALNRGFELGRVHRKGIAIVIAALEDPECARG